MKMDWCKIWGALIVSTVLVLAGCTDYKRVTVNPVKKVSIDQFDTIISDKNFTGLVVVFAVWCKPCRDELPDVADIYNKKDDQSPQLIALSIDDGNEDKVQFLVDDLKLMFPVYQVGTDALKRYKIFGIPSLLTVEAGKIVRKMTGQQDPEDLAKLFNRLGKRVH